MQAAWWSLLAINTLLEASLTWHRLKNWRASHSVLFQWQKKWNRRTEICKFRKNGGSESSLYGYDSNKIGRDFLFFIFASLVLCSWVWRWVGIQQTEVSIHYKHWSQYAIFTILTINVGNFVDKKKDRICHVLFFNRPFRLLLTVIGSPSLSLNNSISIYRIHLKKDNVWFSNQLKLFI